MRSLSSRTLRKEGRLLHSWGHEDKRNVQNLMCDSFLSLSLTLDKKIQIMCYSFYHFLLEREVDLGKENTNLMCDSFHHFHLGRRVGYCTAEDRKKKKNTEFDVRFILSLSFRKEGGVMMVMFFNFDRQGARLSVFQIGKKAPSRNYCMWNIQRLANELTIFFRFYNLPQNRT